jgi:TetR/AcrR family transcriptional repressor of nem operon
VRASRSAKSKSASRLSYVNFLERRFETDPPPQKGQRTRERLKIATAKVLSAKGYHGLRTNDVTETAGVAEGLFYVYFKDKTEASAAVLGSFLEDFVGDHFRQASGYPSAIEAIRATNRIWFALCRANTGLMRCLLQLGDEIPAFASLGQTSNHNWYVRIASSVTRHYPEGAVDPRTALLAAYMLGAMMDELARKLFIYPQAELLALLRELDADDDAVADAATVLWARLLYPGQPLPENLPPVADLLARSLSGGAAILPAEPAPQA